ncbi:MAG: TonB-dependent receptor [Flavobacteriales bacterium]|nr:TonB-dependent receptor [Flavobacteriales bacterium]MDW8410274.1 TonB-dependent receptor [Flavobacteriales bacterium]
MKRFLLLVFFPSFCLLPVSGQTVSGTVTSPDKNPLPFANITVKETGKGTSTDPSGRYRLTLDFKTQKTYTLVASYVGFKSQEKQVTAGTTTVDFILEPMSIMAGEVVVTGSRISESVMEAPVSIQKLNTEAIISAPSGNFYENLRNLRGVDINTSSAGFQAVNMRGFNTTAPVRIVQFVDGMDNQAPGLNFPVGNLVGANPLDLASTEVITGPASALYGPNAFQGVINMISKNPYDYQGLDVELKAGERRRLEANFRYAQTVDKKQRLAFKITGSYLTMRDWIADDPVANRYGDLTANVNLSNIVQQLQYDSTLSQEDRDRFVALNNYIEFNPIVAERGLNVKQVVAPGYMENQLANNDVKSLKASAALHYRFNKNSELSYTFKFGYGSAIYQGANRYAIRDIRFMQHKVQYQNRDLLLKFYTTGENAGNSYDIVFTGINVTRASIGDLWVPAYLSTFFSVLGDLNNDYNDDASAWMVDSAMNQALRAADTSWYRPGTAAFDSVVNSIVRNANLQRGSLFVDRSALYHLDAQYTFPQILWLNLTAGANFRLYRPRSFGTIFADTLINRADTLPDGSADLNARFKVITNWEIGGFVQAVKKFWDDKLRITASVRFDKNQNFPLQFSPRLSLSYTADRNHTFRLGGQMAFRNPTLQNQFIRLDLGPIKLLGNLNGFDNLYTLNSVTAFLDSLDAVGGNLNQVNPNLLETVAYDKIRPENVKTIEVGYRGLFSNKVFIDADFFHNWYTNFIGEVRVVRPLGGAVAGEQSGFDAIVTGNYERYQIPVNARETVRSIGGGIGATWFITRTLSWNANYQYNRLLTEGLNSEIIPGFNTPEHKVSTQLNATRIYKGLGFNVGFQWVDSYLWQSPFGIGEVPSYYFVDAQISYAVDVGPTTTTVRFGGSNLTNFRRREIYGGPLIGRLLYGSLTFSWNKLKKGR